MIRVTVALIAGAMLLHVGCSSGDEAAADTVMEEQTAASEGEVKAELASRTAAFGAALNSGDVARIMEFWTDDAHLLEPGLDVDRPGLEMYLRDAFGAGTAITGFETRPRDVFIHGDVAYELGSYDETVIPSPGAEPVMIENHFFLRWERAADGVWRMDRVVTGTRAAAQ